MATLSSLFPQDTEGRVEARYHVFQVAVFLLIPGEPQCVHHECDTIGPCYTEVGSRLTHCSTWPLLWREGRLGGLGT